MTGWRFPLVVTVYAGLLLLVGLVGGNVVLMLAVSALVLISFALGHILTRDLNAFRRESEARVEAAGAPLLVPAEIRELRLHNESLKLRNGMLVGLLAKDGLLLADLEDFLSWRAGDVTAAQDQAIANVSGERR